MVQPLAHKLSYTNVSYKCCVVVVIVHNDKGWSGTTNFTDEWVYDGIAQQYALDTDMANTLRRNNPEVSLYSV
jgi:CobN/Magnesium Chelatase